MNSHNQAIIDIGAVFPSSDDELFSLRAKIPRSYFQLLADGRFTNSQFLMDVPFQAAFNYLKGLVACEAAGISAYSGSTSLVIWAFNSLQRRPIEEWAAVAVWIIQHHHNPYSPFDFRRTRDHWEQAIRESDVPTDIALRAHSLEKAYHTHKRAIAERQAVREHLDQLSKHSPPASDNIRQRMIEELERAAGWPEER